MSFFQAPTLPTPPMENITRGWYSEGKTYWTDDLALQTELNTQDSVIEHWFQIAQSSYDASIKFIKSLLKKVLGPMYANLKMFGGMLTHLISAILNFTTNIMYLTTAGISGAMWYFSIASLISSFTSFIVSVTQLFNGLGYSFHSDSAISCAKNIAPDLSEAVSNLSDASVKPEIVIPNGLKSEAWVKIAVGSIVAILCAGLGLTTNTDFRKVIMHADVLDRAKKTTNTVSDIANFVIKEVIGNECDEDYAQCKQLEDLALEGSALIEFSAAHFVSHPPDYYRLRKFAEKIIKVTSIKMDKDVSSRYHTVRQLLVQQYRRLSEKLESVKNILSTKQRQATVPILFSGKRGVGKSDLCKYIVPIIAKQLQYNPAIYTLNKRKDGFFEAYGNQQFGIYNEWMATREEDALLHDFNLIFSSDPVNLEGAALDCKHQQCQLAAGFLTSNVDNPKLTDVLNLEAAKATWDRIWHVRVIDDKCQGRNAPNPHRRPDFSHLRFVRVDHKDLNVQDGPELTLKDIINRIVGKLAFNESRFIDTLVADPNISEEDRKVFASRKETLRSIMQVNPPFDTVPNLFDVDVLLFPDGVKPNGLSREFFTIRFQGDLGCGKSTLAESVLEQLPAIFNLDYQISRSLDEFVPDPDRPMIYVMDDWVETTKDNTLQVFLQKMNSTDDKSLFILTSNTRFSPVKRNYSLASVVDSAYAWWNGLTSSKPLDASGFVGPVGVLRRMGLQGSVVLPGGTVAYFNENFNKTFDVSVGFVYRDRAGKTVTSSEIFNIIYQSYNHFRSVPSRFKITSEPPSYMVDPDAKIVAPNAKSLINLLKSRISISKALFGSHSDCYFYASEAVLKGSYKKGGVTSSSVSHWVLPSDTPDDDDSAREVFSRLCAMFEKICPGKALHIQLTESTTQYYYHNHIGYIYTKDQQKATDLIDVFDDYILVREASDKARKITIDDYIGFKYFGHRVKSYESLELHEVLRIERYIGAIVNDVADTSRFRINYLRKLREANIAARPKAVQLRAALTAHPLFWFAMGLLGLIGYMGALQIFSHIKKWYSKPDSVFGSIKDEKIYKNENTFDFNRKQIASKMKAFRNADTPVWHPKIAVKAEKLADKAVEIIPNGRSKRDKYIKEIGAYLDDPKQQDPVMNALTTDTEAPLAYKMAQALNLFGKDTPTQSQFVEDIRSNALEEGDMIKQNESIIETLHKKLNKNYFNIKSPRGNCYGIGLADKYILTVSHLLGELGDTCFVQSRGVVYTAVTVLIDRDRDLSVIKVIDKNFPSIANTNKFFASQSSMRDATHGYMLRCGPSMQVMGGHTQFCPVTEVPITDGTPEFNVTRKVVVFLAAYCYDITTFVRSGDCGFPLLVPDFGGQYRVGAIHNAFTQSKKVYFVSFSQEDHALFLKNAREYQVPEDIVIPNCDSNVEVAMDVVEEVENLIEVEVPAIDQAFLLPETYATAINNMELESRFSNYSQQLQLLGFSKDLALRSRPNLKAFHLDVPGMLSPNLKLPAAFNMDYVTDPDPKYVAVRDDGRPDPLFGQCVKYDKTVEYSYDPEILEIAAAHVVDDIYYRYGDCKFLRTHEVLNGKYNDALSPFDPTTSAGPLLKAKFGITNKLPIFDINRENPNCRVFCFDNNNPASVMVKNHYRQYCEALESDGPPPLMVSKDCAKVELISAETASKGKVRLFNEVDLSINMVLKRYFGDLQNRVMADHDDNPIKMGQNPYRQATVICKDFARFSGEVVSTDFSAFDKQLPAVLIKIFCSVASRCYEKKNLTPELVHQLYNKLAISLTYVIHTCRGTIYFVDRGNESGTFVTTLLNSISVRTLTLYTMIRKWREIYHYTPSLRELSAEYSEAIYGDDRTLKVSQLLPVTMSDLVEDSKRFGLTCKEAKTSGGIDFCSRDLSWDPVNQIAWPALKTESILGLVRWYKSTERNQILDNIDNALFEAALHSDPEVFKIALHDVLIALDYFAISPLELEFISRDMIRNRFIAYVHQYDEYTWITLQAEREIHKDSEYYDSVVTYKRAFTERQFKRSLTDNTEESVNSRLKRLRKYLNKPLTVVMTDPKYNPVSALLEALQACRIPDRPELLYAEDKETRLFTCTATLMGETSEGTGATKAEAKRSAFSGLYTSLAEVLSVQRNALSEDKSLHDQLVRRISKPFMFSCIRKHLAIAEKLHEALDVPVIVLAERPPELFPREKDGIRYSIDALSNVYCFSETANSFRFECMAKIYYMQPGVYVDREKAYVGMDVIIPNSGRPVQQGPSLVGDVSANPGISTIPNLPNVVSVNQTAPAMMNNDPPSMAAFEPLMPVQNLNPAGPPNMISAGAIGFDIKDLAYNQFIDCDKQYTFTDDTTDGSIIFQIPYDPTSEWMNPYAKAYISLHERYAGPLRFRFTVVGNQTFSGFLALCWQPQKTQGNTIKISEAMKYNYIAESINQPFSCIFDLNDARKDMFWRSLHDVKDVDQRPHLVCFVMLTAVSPLKTGITIRIRIGSILHKTFQVANPLVSPPKVTDEPMGLYTNDVTRLLGQPVVPILARPMYPDAKQFHMVLDGNTYFNSPLYNTSDFIISNWNEKWTGVKYPVVTNDEKFPHSMTFVQMKVLVQPNVFCWVDASRCISDFFVNLSRTDAEPDTDFHRLMADVYQIVKDTKGNVKIVANELLKKRGDIYYVINFNTLKEFNLPGSPNIKQENQGSSVLMTRFGPIFLYVMANDFMISNGPFGPNFDMEPTQIQSVVYKNGSEPMPAGWRHCAITMDLPYVAVEALLSSHCPVHPSIMSLIKSLNLDIKPTECLQIAVSDYESARLIATLRYFPDRGALVVNVGDNPIMFATSLRAAERMYISAIGVYPRTNDFPLTEVNGNFADNQVHPDVLARYYRPSEYSWTTKTATPQVKVIHKELTLAPKSIEAFRELIQILRDQGLYLDKDGVPREIPTSSDFHEVPSTTPQ